jgi:integrase
MSKSQTPPKQADIAKLSCEPHRKATEHTVDAAKVPGLFVEVRHTGGMTYYLRYRDSGSTGNGNGKTRYQKIGRTMDISLADAKKVALKLRAGILLGNYPGADKRDKQLCMTFTEFFEQKYLPFAKPRKRSWLDDDKLFNRRLKALFGSLPLDKITRHSLQQMHSDLRSELSASSCDHHLGLMSRCLRLAMDWKLITENPAQGLKKYNEDNRRDRLMTDSELQRLVATLDTDPARTACLVIKWCLYTACRKGEALHLKFADINRDTNTWTIQAATAKSKKRRVVPLNSAALAILDELSQGNDSEWVFLNSRNGERLKSVDKVWQRVRSTANLPEDIVIHSLRHMGASMMLSSGADLATVRDILGHADISTTEKYLHASGQSLRSGAAGIEDYLEKALANSES